MGFLVVIALMLTGAFFCFGIAAAPFIYKNRTVSHKKAFLVSFGLAIICAFLMYLNAPEAFSNTSSGTSSGSHGKHPCAVCGKTEGTKKITAKAGNGEWDENWYCSKHYADAWQYYYGNGK